MRGMRLSGAFVKHELGVAVVGGDEHLATGLIDCPGHAFDVFVNGFDGFHCGFEIAAVANHVSIGEIADYDIVRTGFYRLHHAIGNLTCAHFRFLVVGGDIRGRRHQYTVFVVERIVSAAIEEKGDVGVFFRFSHAQLAIAATG